MTLNQSRTIMKKDPFTTRPDRIALAADGAPAWAGGSQRCNGNSAVLARRPVVIGVSYELARMKTIRPQSWDVPMDWVVTERGTYRRDPEGLVFIGAPLAGAPGALASPVCYAGELDPESPPGT